MLAVLFCIAHAIPSLSLAQTFHFSLESMDRYYRELEKPAWDTLSVGDISELKLGQFYYIPNFLEHDFRRVRRVAEYAPIGHYRVVFEVPLYESFTFEEEKQGVFYVGKPRNFDLPGLGIDIQTYEAIADNIRLESQRSVWRKTLVTALTSGGAEATTQRGLIHVEIPLPLGPLERVLGQGDKTNIDISGRESITFAGESKRINPFIGVEGQKKQPLFPSLEMKQELDIRLKGQVGEKVNVQVDHSSNDYSEGQNKIRLNYVGFEDDVIQLIEMGNTSLSLPGSNLGGFSSASKGLFGIKMLAQLGPVDVTMVASKQEGETSTATFVPTGGGIGQTESRRIADTDYVKNKYFYLDSPYGPFIRPEADRVKAPEGIEVFVSVSSTEIQQNPDGVWFMGGKAFVDSFATGQDIQAAMAAYAVSDSAILPDHEEADFRKLEFQTDFQYIVDVDSNYVIGIELSQAVDNYKILAVRYKNIKGDIIGNYGEGIDKTAFLELIKPYDPRPDGDFGYTWPFMMRNIYNLGLSKIDGNTLEIEIEDLTNRNEPSIPEDEVVPYLRIFGLDQVNQNGSPPPDNLIDLTSGLIDLDQGILTFPSLRPFDPPYFKVAEWTARDDSSISSEDLTKFRNPDIYDKYLSTSELLQTHKYNLVIRASSTSRSFRIDAFNIVEGSEVITINGDRLNKGVDYSIDYTTGEVELKGEKAQIDPSARIQVDYESTPLGGAASSSLFGTNALWNISQKSRLGTTWLYQSKSSATKNPKLGEEPTRGAVGNLYGNIQFEPDLLTHLVNLLPLVRTDDKSSVQVSGEVAASFPNPNTEGEVYIDDMEGIEDSDVFSLNRRSWWWASPPVDPGDDYHINILDPEKRERFFWYNIEPALGVHRRDLNPTLDDRENNLVTSLDIEFDTMTDDSTHWGGVMAGFPGGGLDLSQGQFLELWINDFKSDDLPREGKVYIELGTIDEDFYEPEKDFFNNEDKNRDGFVPRNEAKPDVPELNEDSGLNGIWDKDGDTTDDDFDPSRDPATKRYIKINGTEGNYLLDSEDLDRNGVLDEKNSYFRYTLDLSSEAEVDIRRDFPNYEGFRNSGHERDSWRLYRIELDKAEVINRDGRPSMDQIRHVRIWFENIPQVVTSRDKRFQIAGLKVIGNRWEEDGVRDLQGVLVEAPNTTDFALGTINTKTEPIKYKPPIQPNKQNDIIDKEQSLFVDYTDLEPNTAIRIRKRFSSTGENYTNYREMAFWAHTDVMDDSLEFYFQIAYDSLNYYEISAPLTPKYFSSIGWMRTYFDLSDLTSLKFLTPDSNSVTMGALRDIAEMERTYRTKLVGKPDLFRVRFLYTGVRNLYPRPDSSVADSAAFIAERRRSGELWLDDIYLGDVKRDIDFATNLSGSINMGNIIKLNAVWSRTGPDYRGLQQTRGSGSLNQSYSFGLHTDLRYLVPTLGFSVPVATNYSRSVVLPKFTPNSDTELSNEAIRDSLKTETITKGFSANLSKKGSRNPLLKYSIDKMTTSIKMSQAMRKAPTSADTTNTIQGSMDYQISWTNKRDLSMPMFDRFKLRYWLNSLTYRVNANRVTGQRSRIVGARQILDPPTWRAGIDQSGSASYVPFPSLTSSFNMSMQRSLNLPHKWLGVDIGTETSRNQSFQAEYKPPPVWLIKAFSPDFNYIAGYGEDSSPNVRKANDPKGTMNSHSNRSIKVKARFDIGKYLGDIFKRIGLLEKTEPPSKSMPRPASKVVPVPTGNTVGQVDTSTSPADTTAGPARDPLIALRKVGGLLSRIRRVDVSVQQLSNSNYTRIPERPSLKYQMGVSKDSGVRRKGESYDEPESYRSTLTIDLDSGAQITTNIDVATGYLTMQSKTVSKGTESESRSTTWPDLNFKWNGLEQIIFFKNLVSNANANLNYRKTTQESGQQGKVTTRTENLAVGPSLSAGWANGLTGTLNLQMTRRTTVSYGSKNETSTYSATMDLKKSFNGSRGLRIPIPLLSKRFKFKSRLNTSLNMNYSLTRGKRYKPNSDLYDELPGTSSIRVSPQMTYNFSSSLNGSLFIDYSRNYSDATGQTVTSVRVGINAVLNF